MKHFVCFCLSTGFSPNTSLLSDQKGPAIFDVVCERESEGRRGEERRGVEGGAEEVSSSDIQLQSSVTQRSVCWEII